MPKVEANCDHLVEQSFFVTEYLNKWRAFYKGLEHEDQSRFCGPFENTFKALQHEINDEKNILRVDFKMHNMKNQLVSVADGLKRDILLDGIVAEIFTQDELFAQKYMHKFIPTDGNLEPIRAFINGPVADAVEHFKIQLLANQQQLEKNIKFDPLRKQVAASNIALQAIAKLEKRHTKLVTLVNQYERYLQSSPRLFVPKSKNGQTSFGVSSSVLPDYFTPDLHEFDQKRVYALVPTISNPDPMVPKKIRVRSENTKDAYRKRLKLDRGFAIASEEEFLMPLQSKFVNVEDAQHNIANYLLKSKKRFAGLSEFDTLEKSLGRSIGKVATVIESKI